MRTILLSSLISGIFLTLSMYYLETSQNGSKGLTTDVNTEVLTSSVQAQSLTCLSNVQLSLDSDGYGVLEPQMLLAGNYQDYSRFEVTIVNPPVNTDTADCSMVGSTIMVEVYDTQQNISCWSSVLVEDKLPPTTNCSTVDVPCNLDPYANNIDLFLPDLYDNCTDTSDLVVTFNQVQSTTGCQSPYVLLVDRTWFITDEAGNTTSCTQLIRFERPDMDSIVFPMNDTLYCPDTDTDPSNTGVPTLYGEAVSMQCGLMVWNEDNIIDKCGETFKVMRRWYVMDWCRNIQLTDLQVIEVLDTTAPVVTCPSDQTINTFPGECYGLYTIPPINVEDDCTLPGDFDFDYYVNGVFTNQTQNIPLDRGVNEIRIVVRDACNNSAQCTYEVVVEDNETPIVICYDDILGLPSTGDITVGPGFFPSIQYNDNCDIVDTMIRRVNSDCGNPNDQIFGDEITICCDDVGDTIMIEVKGIDGAGNMNSCMFMLEVQDNLPPDFVFCPADTTINCDVLPINDYSVYGTPVVTDNCNFTVDSSVTINLDDCKEGSIFRTWIATDEFGNKDTCIQEITVMNTDTFDPSTIVWPSDITVSACAPGGLDPDSLGSRPDFRQTACMTVGTSYTDMTPSQDSACVFIMRTWTITDSCEDTDTSYIQMITQINSAPPVLTIPSDTTLYADGICLGEATLAAASTNDCSSGVTFENSYSSQGAQVDTVFPLGQTEIIFTAIDECNNVSEDTMIVTVEDTTSPTIICLPDTTFSTETDICSAIVELQIPITDDNCRVISVVNDYNGTADASDTYPLGNTTVTYTVTDTSLNITTCSFTITVEDDVPPVLVCPTIPDTLYLDSMCNVTIPDYRDSISVTDNCSSVGDITLSQTPMDMTMLMGVQDTIIQIIAEDEAGNMDTCEIPIHLIDTLPPDIMCPENDTIYLDDNCEAVIGNYRDSAMVMSNCTQIMNVLITQSPDSGTIVSGANNTIEITLTAEDSSMNTMSCTFSLTLLDTTPPEIVILNDTTVSNDTGQCGAFITFPIPSVSDNCIIDSFYNDYNLDSNASDFYPVGDTVVRYIVVDESGNTTIDSFMVTVEDNEGPIINCPADVTIECTTQADTTTTGGAIASDNCGGIISITFSDDTTAGNCVGDYIIDRTFEAEDQYGNVSNCTQTITVVDTVAPVFDINPMDTVVDCDAVVPMPSPMATDNCGNVTMTATSSIMQGACPNEFIIDRTWTAEDECGNMTTINQTVTIQDTTAPVINCPADITIECIRAADTTITGSATATDNCETDVTITYSDDTTAGSCASEYIIARTFVADDSCGNVSSCIQTITVVDTVAPVFDNPAPADTTVDCDGVPMMVSLTATDNCGMVTITTSEDTTAGSCPQEYTLRRVWTAADECGNLDSVEQIVTVIDTVSPLFDSPAPADTTVDCDGVPMMVSLTATDNCGMVTITTSEDTTASNCPQEYTLRRVWTAMDECGNLDSVEQIVTVIDTVFPVFDSPAPADTTVECDNIPAMGTLTATDNCGMVTITTSEDTTAGNCPQEYTLRRVWTAMDECGNVDSVEQTINVIDTTAPVFDINPMDTVVDCDAAVPMPSPMATDNCGTVTMTAASSISPGACPNEQVISRSWTAEDECGNMTTITQTVTIQDTTAPVITCPADITVACTERADTVVTGAATATDNCETEVAITFSDDTTSGICAGEFVIARTFVADDSCGNLDSCTQLITVIDTVAPTFDNLPPADTTIACDATVPAAVTLTATDNCSGATVIYTVDTTSGICPQEFTINRLWVASDVCGNSSSVSQQILIVDTVAPVFDSPAPADTTVDCDAVPAFASLTATDNCGMVTITTSEDTIAGSCPQEYTLVRVWTALDECGNADSLNQVINVIDTTAPVFDNLPPADTTVNCDAVPAAVTLTATDNCGMATVTFSEDTTDGMDPILFVLRRVWTAVDPCGNLDSVEQFITVQDTTPPNLTCPSDTSLTLGANCQLTLPDFTGDAIATDNCSPSDSIMFEQIPSAGSIIAEEGDTTILIIATDNSGNSDTCDFIVTIEDQVPPTIICPATDTVFVDALCSFELKDYRDSATVSDNCTDTIDITITQIPDSGTIFNLGGDTTIVIQLIASDLSGNMDTCEFDVVVRDTIPPSITCLNDVTIYADENCKAIIPDLTDSVVLSDNCAGDTAVSATQSPMAGDTLMGEQTISITFTAMDMNGQTVTCSINLTVQDTTPPMLTCPPDTQLVADSLCQITIPDFIPEVVYSDNCTDSADLIISQNPAADSVIDVQAGDTIVVVIVVQDSSGNADSCEVLIEVIDTLPPTLVCTGDPDTVFLDANCAGAIPDLTSEITVLGDNCTANASITISQEPTVGTVFIVDGSFDTSVVITVEDGSGNTATCTIPVYFIDNTPPMLSCPPDSLVPCGYPFDLNDLTSEFGFATATDNCSGVSIIVTESTFRNDCQLIDSIERTFVATDDDGNSSICVQTIRVNGTIIDLDSTDFNYSDTVSTADCNLTDPSNIPGSIPELDSNLLACNVIGITYTDSVNPSPTLACIEIFRTFTIIDSCNFDPNSGQGQFEIEQYVLVNDTTLPVLVPPIMDTTIYLDTCGTKRLILDTVTATDCAGIDTIYNNSLFAFSTAGGDISGDYPFGIHDVDIFAEDSCGNIDSVTITVTVTDSFPDTLSCNFKDINSLDTSISPPTAFFFAGEFFNFYGDSCGNPPLGEIDLSFSSNNPNDTLILVTCDSINPGQNYILEKMLYIFLDGVLVDSCDIELGIENPEVCDTSSTITGTITSVQGEAFRDVRVDISSEFSRRQVISDNKGIYTTDGIWPGLFYLVDPFYEYDPLEGISTYDILLIHRHILGMQAIDNPYYNIAADVDKSRSISGADLIHLKKLILRLTDQLPIDQWRFVDGEYVFRDPVQAAADEYPERLKFKANGDLKGMNFIGLKVGDVDGSLDMNARVRSAPTYLNVEKDGQALSFNSSISDLIFGFQLEVDMGRYQDIHIESAKIDLSHEDYSITEDGKLLISWTSPHGVTIDKGESLFTISNYSSSSAGSIRQISLSEDNLNAEIYRSRVDGISDLQLRYVDQDKEFALYQNAPNPWTDRTVIPFNLKEGGKVQLRVLNASGQEVLQIDREAKAGYNEVYIRSTDLEGPGVYYYQLIGEDLEASKKMILVQ